MNEIKLYKQEAFYKFKEFESRDLSYSSFCDINFSEYVHSISFFRSDFRGSKFINVKFYKNNLDRSDFINAVFIDCDFEKVNFGCCQIKNCYLKKINFQNNSYRNTSIHSSTFVDCVFPDESFLINMQHCHLINCSFSGCNFEMSTTDNDIFERCKFDNTNLATMHSENHTFIECQFDNVYIDSSYFFGYSITNTNMENVLFLYRGEYVDFKNICHSQFYEKFKYENRYNESINLLKICNRQSEIVHLMDEFIMHYSKNSYGRMLDITNVFNNLIFSSIYEEIDFNILYSILNKLDKTTWDSYSFEDKNEIKSMIIKFQNTLFLNPHSEAYILSIDENHLSVLSIKYKNCNLDACIKKSQNFINSISDYRHWKLVETKQGSWILTFIVPALILINILPKIIKNYTDVYFDIQIKRHLSQKLIEQLNTLEPTNKNMKELLCNASKAQLMIPTGKYLNENIESDIKSIEAKI